MASSSNKGGSTVSPPFDERILKLLQRGSVKSGELAAAFRQLEKKTVSTEVRAAQKLYDLHQEMQEELGREMKQFRSVEDWDRLRKLARGGVRLAKRFKVPEIDYAGYFKTMHDTARSAVSSMSRGEM